MAAYGSQLTKGKSEQESLDFVKTILEKTSVQDDSARDSLATFQGGKGDVLIGYENEALQAQEEGVELEYVIPDDTILIENPAAVTVDADDRPRPSSSTSRSRPRGSSSSPTPATARLIRRSSQENADKFPEPGEPVHDRRVRRLERGRRRVLR